MKALLLVTALLLAAVPAHAELHPGSKAPDFTTEAALGGNQFTFSLADALKKGPVVVYFYPAAFTSGCTIEAHEFAEARDEFTAAGATIIGVSSDDIATLKRFSVSECGSKFAVAADGDMHIIKAYDANLPLISYAKRTSYVIAPDRTVLYSYTDMDPEPHITNTLAAVRKWQAEHK
jgi:thioredoxin-dependent peroxiredoxin